MMYHWYLLWSCRRAAAGRVSPNKEDQDGQLGFLPGGGEGEVDRGGSSRSEGLFLTPSQLVLLGLVEFAPVVSGVVYALAAKDALKSWLAVGCGLVLAGVVIAITRHRVPPETLYEGGEVDVEG